MSSTREVKVLVASRATDGREPETRDGVFAKRDAELGATQAELEEAIALLQIQVRDIQAKRELLSQVQADIQLAEGEDS